MRPKRSAPVPPRPTRKQSATARLFRVPCWKHKEVLRRASRALSGRRRGGKLESDPTLRDRRAEPSLLERSPGHLSDNTAVKREGARGGTARFPRATAGYCRASGAGAAPAS